MIPSSHVGLTTMRMHSSSETTIESALTIAVIDLDHVDV